MVCALACLGVLTTIRRKRFYRNFILINKTLLLAHLFIHVCFSTIMLAKAKKTRTSVHQYFFVFCFVFLQTKHSGKPNHRSLPESVLKSLTSQHCECFCHHAVQAWSYKARDHARAPPHAPSLVKMRDR